MGKFSDYTIIELNKHAQELKSEHENCKTSIIEHAKEIEVIENSINEKMKRLSEIESDYVDMIEEINKR